MRRERERGATMLLAAMSLVSLLTATALAVDIGVGAAKTRDLQQVADLIALDVARMLDGSNPPAGIDAQVAASSARNDFPVTGTFPTYTAGVRRVELVLGCWEDANPVDGTLDFTPVAAASPTCPNRPDAVRVRAYDDVDYKFADVIGIRDDRFDRAAVAARVPTVGVEIGSVAAGLQAGLAPTNTSAQIDAYVDALNGRLRAGFGTNANFVTPPGDAGLDAASYRGLAASDVGLGTLAAAAGFASPSQLANATITNGQFFDAMVTALQAENNTVAAGYVQAFRNLSGFNSAGTMRLGSGPLQFEQGTGTADDPGAAAARVNVLDLLVGGASVVDNRNFFSYDITPQIPGVASVRVENRVVEPMQRKWGPVGTTVGTAQIRQQLTLNLTGASFGITSLLGQSIPITLPIVVEGATGDATLTRIECLDPIGASEADLAAVTSIARLTFGTASNLQAEGNPALSINTSVNLIAGNTTLSAATNLTLGLLAGLTGDLRISGQTSLGGGSSTHTFNPEPPPGPPLQRSMGGVAASAGTGLQSNLSVVSGGANAVNVRNAFNSLFTNLGAGIVDPVLHAAGITLGGADLRAMPNLRCQEPSLVG